MLAPCESFCGTFLKYICIQKRYSFPVCGQTAVCMFLRETLLCVCSFPEQIMSSSRIGAESQGESCVVGVQVFRLLLAVDFETGIHKSEQYGNSPLHVQLRLYSLASECPCQLFRCISNTSTGSAICFWCLLIAVHRGFSFCLEMARHPVCWVWCSDSKWFVPNK